MSKYLRFNNRMLTRQNGRKYLGHEPFDFSSLLYLTYFRHNFMMNGIKEDTDHDDPVVSSMSSPIQSPNTYNYYHLDVGIDQLSGTNLGLDSRFTGVDYMSATFNDVGRELYEYPVSKTSLKLPLGTSGWFWQEVDREYTITFRTKMHTNGYSRIVYESSSDIDEYWNLPRVGISSSNTGVPSVGYETLCISDYDNSRYPGKVLLGYLYPHVAPPGTQRYTLYNDTSFQTYEDPGYSATTAWPPAGRQFSNASNSTVSLAGGDQWYHFGVVHRLGEAFWDIYVNGKRMARYQPANGMHLDTKELYLSLNPKEFDTTTLGKMTSCKLLGNWRIDLTELAVFSKDLSYNQGDKLHYGDVPLYVKTNQYDYEPNYSYQFTH